MIMETSSMYRAIVFRTPGLIDIRAFTHFGVNSKPNSVSPIGYFGTGLKYAIAVLVREGINPVVWIGDKKYTFYASKKSFRDKEFTFIKMRRETGWDRILPKVGYQDLPFTTELGKNWKLWQAFRELESNTRDEGGSTGIEYWDNSLGPVGCENVTLILVPGEAFVNEYLDRDKTFLPEGLQLRATTEELQVFEKPSHHIYYRGLRIIDLPENQPTQNTYNILREIELTEDRTAKHEFTVKDIIAGHLATQAPRSTVQRAFSSAGGYESRLHFDYLYRTPSEAFTLEVKENAQAPSSAKQLVETHEPKAPIADPFADSPRPWAVQALDSNALTIVDANCRPIPRLLLRQALAVINAHSGMLPDVFDELSPAPAVVAVPNSNTDEEDEEIPF